MQRMVLGLCATLMTAGCATGRDVPASHRPMQAETARVSTQPVDLHFARHPPAGTTWRELDVYARDQSTPATPAFEHHYHKLLEAQVTIAKQTPALEVYEVEVVRAESRSERITSNVFAPGAKLRLSFTPSNVTIEPPVTEAERILLADLFVPAWSVASDDVLLGAGPHRIGETWSMARDQLARALNEPAAALTRATVELVDVTGADTAAIAHVRAAYATRSANGAIEVDAPVNPSVPVPRQHLKVRRPLGNSVDDGYETVELTQTRTAP